LNGSGTLKYGWFSAQYARQKMNRRYGYTGIEPQGNEQRKSYFLADFTGGYLFLDDFL